MLLAGGTAGSAPGNRIPPGVRLVASIPLPGVGGRLDHLALDRARHRLFVAALGNGTVEVLDLRANRRSRTLPGWHEPQGVCFVPSSDRLFVADADGRCVLLDGQSLTPLRTVRLSGDADNLRWDEKAGRVLVGFGEGGVVALDARSGDSLAAALLPSHPEAFQLEPRGDRIFVNLPGSREVAVLDRSLHATRERWALPPGEGLNFPMALDTARGRLLVGCRRPGRLLQLDTRSGRTMGSLPLCDDADDLFFDAPGGRLYATCGEGFLDVFALQAGQLVHLSRVRTAPGARTGLLVPEEGRLYLAVPHRGTQRAEIRVYDLAHAD